MFFLLNDKNLLSSSLSWAKGSSIWASKPAENNKNSGLNSLIFLKHFHMHLRYSSAVVPASSGIFKILLNLPFSFSEPDPG